MYHCENRSGIWWNIFLSLREAVGMLSFHVCEISSFHLAHAENWPSNRFGFALIGRRNPTVLGKSLKVQCIGGMSLLENDGYCHGPVFYLWLACQTVPENSQLWWHTIGLSRRFIKECLTASFSLIFLWCVWSPIFEIPRSRKIGLSSGPECPRSAYFETPLYLRQRLPKRPTRWGISYPTLLA